MNIKFEKVCLNYKDNKGTIYNELVLAVKEMNDSKNFDIEKFYDYLNNIIINLSEEKQFQIIRLLPTTKPYYLFGVLYYHLKDSDEKNKMLKEFDYLKQFIDYRIDLFMIVNYLRNK